MFLFIDGVDDCNEDLMEYLKSIGVCRAEAMKTKIYGKETKTTIHPVFDRLCRSRIQHLQVHQSARQPTRLNVWLPKRAFRPPLSLQILSSEGSTVREVFLQRSRMSCKFSRCRTELAEDQRSILLSDEQLLDFELVMNEGAKWHLGFMKAANA